MSHSLKVGRVLAGQGLVPFTGSLLWEAVLLGLLRVGLCTSTLALAFPVHGEFDLALRHHHHHGHHLAHLGLGQAHSAQGLLGVLVGAVLALAVDSELADDLGVDEEALLAVGAGGEVLAVLRGVEVGALLVRVVAIGVVFALYQPPSLLLGCSLLAGLLLLFWNVKSLHPLLLLLGRAVDLLLAREGGRLRSRLALGGVLPDPLLYPLALALGHCSLTPPFESHRLLRAVGWLTGLLLLVLALGVDDRAQIHVQIGSALSLLGGSFHLAWGLRGERMG